MPSTSCDRNSRPVTARAMTMTRNMLPPCAALGELENGRAESSRPQGYLPARSCVAELRDSPEADRGGTSGRARRLKASGGAAATGRGQDMRPALVPASRPFLESAPGVHIEARGRHP